MKHIKMSTTLGKKNQGIRDPTTTKNDSIVETHGA